MSDITKSTSCSFRKSKTSCPFLQLATTLIYLLLISAVIPSKKIVWSSAIIILIVFFYQNYGSSTFIFINAFIILIIKSPLKRADSLALS